MADNSELLNEAEIDFLLTSAAEDATAASTQVETEQTVTMRGDLQQINLADIFQTLAMAKMQGVLRLRNPLEERQIYCRDGYVQLLVPNRVSTRRLGQRMIQAGLLTGDQLRAALIAQRKVKLPIGELLVKDGVVTQEQVDEIIGMQIGEDLFSVFTWKHGTFEFFKYDGANSGADAFAGCPEFEVNSLLLEVARRSDEWESISAVIVTLEEVPGRIADPEDESALTEVHQAMLANVDGVHTYRELAEQTTFGLFEASRAARDLVNGGLIANISDSALVSVANRVAAAGENKKAVLLLQTLRDRPGDRPLGVLQTMASAMQNAGEKRLGGQLLLEAAQRQPDAEAALELARTAHALSPHDPEVLSFLRTVLIAHGAADSPELEDCTIELLDALIEAERLPAALDIIDDARRTGTVQAQVLVREARAKQKARDLKGAADALFELGQLYEAQGDRAHAVESYQSLLRVDRSRRDVQKLITSLQRTRLGSIIRFVALLLVLAMVGGMGFVLWQQHTFEAQVDQATTEISTLLGDGNRAGAAARLADWQTRLGSCEPIDDLRSRVAFAEAAERTRQQKELRMQINEQLTAAADLLGHGELQNALQAYEKLWQRPDLKDEIDKVVVTRFDVLLASLEQAAKSLTNNLPSMPNTLLDRRDLTTNLADLQTICPPTTLRLVTELRQMHVANTLPEFLAPAQRHRIEGLLAGNDDIFARARQLVAAYEAALHRNDQQRQLDPMFKAAVNQEKIYDFQGALDNYRELERQTTNDGELRAHFRDRVARNATIVKLMGALKAATERGDFEAAQQQLRALRLSYPDVPFGQIVRLPLHVDSQPIGATVTVNGAEAGRTPLVLARIPEQPTQLVVSMDGFVSEQRVVQDDSTPVWTAHLILGADSEWKHDSAVDVAPVGEEQGALFLVDRAGVVTARHEGGRGDWGFRSGDLSGLLTTPILHEGLLVVGSLDGELRALDAKTGEVKWSLPDLPTEVAPQLVGNQLLMLTTDGRLRGIDLAQRQVVSRDLPQSPWGSPAIRADRVFAIGERSLVMALELPRLAPVWQKQVDDMGHASVTVAGNMLIAANDRGGIVGIDPDTGEVRWRRNLDCEVIGNPVAVDGRIVVVTPPCLLELDGATGHDLRKLQREDQDWLGAPLAVGERLIIGLHDGPLQVVDTRTLQPLYRLRAPRRSRYLAFGNSVMLVAPDHAIAVFRRLR